ncbi:MAG: purine-nucleoside phosphorylase [Clostridiales Family XIII bacterium]|jgi:purine-nucleoside phosphorylase|nr:purine-nucleoside phosphorylase [Clostridiales Family XIII bacterium]
MDTTTAQNSAKKGDFAKTVLMPGDPHRSKFIAENFVENAALVNDVRGIQGYTGTYKGKPISVMAHGMGCPSIGIYAYELFNIYDVDHIIRIGSAGAISPDLKVRDIVMAIGACTSSNFFNAQYPDLAGSYAPTPSYRLLETAVNVSRELGKEAIVGNVFTSDHFYDASKSALKWGQLGCLAVEMEIAALYFSAHQAGKEALGICTIADHVLNGEELEPWERERTFTDMMEIAIETAIKL